MNEGASSSKNEKNEEEKHEETKNKRGGLKHSINRILKGLSILKDRPFDKPTLENLVDAFNRQFFKNIVTMAGAGISTSAGIPDFRSPDSGIYANLTRYKLPFPEAVFYIEYFKQDPRPFFHLLKEMLSKDYRPTKAHYFIKLLDRKGLLLRHYTQNVDGLERMAGIRMDKVVEAHGTIATSECTR